MSPSSFAITKKRMTDKDKLTKWEYPARIKRQLILTIQSETPSSRNSNAREDDNRITQIHISGDDTFVVPAVSVEIDID